MNIAAADLPKLKRLWDAGLTAVECGVELGLDGTAAEIRQAVMRALEGESVETSAPAIVPPPERRVAAPPPTKPAANDDATPPPFTAPKPIRDVENPFDLEIPAGRRKTIRQLADRDCRWPVGDPRDPGFFFCGTLTVEGESYCSFHCRKAYPATGRRRAA